MKYFVLLWVAALGAKELHEKWKEWRGFERELLQLPQRRIAEVPESMNIRLRGRLEPAPGSQSLVAPLTGRECIAWRVRIEVRAKDLQGGKAWREVALRERAAPAVLVDPTGRARLDRVTKWHVPFDATGGAGHWHDLTAPQAEGARALLEELGLATGHPGWDRDVQVSEAVCPAGEPVVVAAHGRWMRSPADRSASYRDVGRTLHLEKMTTGSLVVTNHRRVLRRTP